MAEIRPAGAGRYQVSGRLSFASVPDLLAFVEAAGDAREVDLSGVSRADSAGLAMLLEWASQVQSHGGVLRLAGIPAQLRSLIRITGVGAVFGLDLTADTVAGEPVLEVE
jgi:phospholipid transport system transporter-binding protein